MPFSKRANLKHPHSVTDTRKLFVGRTDELQFFRENILEPEEPTYNIVSMFGQGGVGKSTLLARVIEELSDANYKDYCLSALVDERQTTPVSIMEQFADQLHLVGDFGKALKQYNELVRTLQTEQETLQTTLLHRAPDFAGAAIEGVPLVGPILREGVKVTAGHLIERYQAGQLQKDREHLHDPLENLTKTFIAELNRMADTQVMLRAHPQITSIFRVRQCLEV
jgi:GTPase SAR1 family protein